jgi:protein CpxP
MTTMLRMTAVAGLLAVSGAALAPAVEAQDGGQGPRARMAGPGPGGPMLPGRIGLPLRELDLSDSQREQVRAIMETHAAALRDLGTRMRTAREGLDDLVTAETVDESAIRAKSADVAAVEADSAVLRARIHHEMFSILTAEQQAKAKELRAAAEARRGQMRERRPRGQDRR